MSESHSNQASPWAVFLIFLRLGLTSFGGPVAHLGYFRDEFVVRKKWLSEKSYADLVALCQFLPGPASSQVGLALGLLRCGYKGAFAAWAGFTLPSALFLIAAAIGITHYGELFSSGVLQGLKIVAVAVVAQAVWGMGRNLCPERTHILIMAVAACIVLFVPSVLIQVGVIVLAGVVGLLLFKPAEQKAPETMPVSIKPKTGLRWFGVFFLLLIGLPILASLIDSSTLEIIDGFYRSGALVFGGGHVVLPLLQAEVVPNFVTPESFMAGYGITQAVPGPLFTFSAFLGASMPEFFTGWYGGLLCLVAIFLPSFFLVAGALPFWESLRQYQSIQAALIGINSAVVGILLAALYQPVWQSAIYKPEDFGFLLLAFVALMFFKLPPWLVVCASMVLGGLIEAF